MSSCCKLHERLALGRRNGDGALVSMMGDRIIGLLREEADGTWSAYVQSLVYLENSKWVGGFDCMNAAANKTLAGLTQTEWCGYH